MTSSILFICLLPVCAEVAQSQSVGGVIYDAGTGKALAFVDVVTNPGQTKDRSDEHGHYTLRGLRPGRYSIHAYSDRGSQASRAITLNAGQDLEAVDFYLRSQGQISGQILDENKEPLPGMAVHLVAREYSLGSIRYVLAGGTTTDDRGEYRLDRVEPGRAYLLLASQARRHLDAISKTPLNPKMRKRAVIPTYYPDTPFIEGAQAVLLSPGEHREGLDIHVGRGPSYCVSAVLENGRGPAEMNFLIAPRQPASGASGDGAFFEVPSGGITGPDGRMRVCDLSPAEYQITVFHNSANPRSGLGFFGTGTTAIADRDVQDVTIRSHPPVHLSGEVVWAGKPPEKPVESKLSIWLSPLMRAQWQGETTQTSSAIPGDFSVPTLLMDDFMPRLHGIPDGSYVKDITYAGVSVLHQPIRLEAAMGNAALRIELACDAGAVDITVTDKDGHPIPDSKVVLLPADSNSEADLADTLVSGETDQNGLYVSAGLAPGKYYVLTNNTPADKSPESIGKLWRSRSHGTEVDVAPNTNMHLTLTPASSN